MKSIISKIVIILFWLVMTGWLLRYEAFPEKFSAAADGYRVLMPGGPLILDSWMQIECQNVPVGYSHTWVDSNLADNDSAYTLRNQTALNFKIMGQGQWVGMSVDATLDDQYALQRFAAAMYSGLYSARVEGKRVKKNVFSVTLSTPANSKTFEMEIPENIVLYSPMLEMAMRRLAPGQQLNLKTIDPLSLTVADVVVEAVQRENIIVDGQARESTKLNISYQGMMINSWIDDNGQVLREETPFGWIIRASTPKEILSQKRQPFDMGDLLDFMAVPVRGQVVNGALRAINPRSCQSLKLRLNGYGLDVEELKSHRQFVEQHIDHEVIISLKTQVPPADIIGLGDPMPANVHQYLASSSAIQADHPEIIGQAKKIIAGSPDCYEAAKSINAWVYQNILKKPAISLPSALDVLQQREGDCNEHTYLFVALARAAGLPARINIGLVYAERGAHGPAFYYHAWPCVYVGEWVEMDPTFGFPLVNATYLRLTTGEIGDQMKLLSIFGRLSVEIIQSDPPRPLGTPPRRGSEAILLKFPSIGGVA